MLHKLFDSLFVIVVTVGTAIAYDSTKYGQVRWELVSAFGLGMIVYVCVHTVINHVFPTK